MSLDQQRIQIKDEISRISTLLAEAPPDLASFRDFVGKIRDLSWQAADEELNFMSFVLDSLLHHLITHVAGEASLIVKQSDAKKLIDTVGSGLKSMAESLEKEGATSLHKSYRNLISAYLETLKTIRTE